MYYYAIPKGFTQSDLVNAESDYSFLLARDSNTIYNFQVETKLSKKVGLCTLKERTQTTATTIVTKQYHRTQLPLKEQRSSTILRKNQTKCIVRSNSNNSNMHTNIQQQNATFLDHLLHRNACLNTNLQGKITRTNSNKKITFDKKYSNINYKSILLK